MYYYERRRRTIGTYKTIYADKSLQEVYNKCVEDINNLEKNKYRVRKILFKEDKEKHPNILLWIKFSDNHNNIILRIRKGE